MSYLNTESEKKNTFDVIVIGSGISGGWAAKEFTEKGLKTLVLERGRDVKHPVDYPTTNMKPWEFEHRLKVTEAVKQENPIVSKCYAYNEGTQHFFVKDKEHPYIQEKPFDWIRGYQVGGKSLLWARQTQRWSDFDFIGPARDNYAVDWPIRYKDLAPWYDYVEKFTGISGNKDGIPQLPDGDFLPPMDMTEVEKYFSQQVSKNFPGRNVIIGRCAHITESKPIYTEQGRTNCQYRDLCYRGCPFGAYFSSNASTLPWAQRTGNLTLMPNKVVHSILYDDARGKATGVKVIDTLTKQEEDFFASIIFVNASALHTNVILLNSKSNRFPQGLGNDNGLLGKYVAFHNYRGNIWGEYHGLEGFTKEGRRPNACYIPRFRNVFKQETGFLRGYAAGFTGFRGIDQSDDGVGLALKENLLKPSLAPWKVGSHMMGETIPKESSTITLDAAQNDDWGVPLAKIAMAYDDNDEKMLQDYTEQMTAMFEAAGFTNIRTWDSHQAPGLDIHEMGGVRMGLDPKTSLLNKWNQLHACKNVFVTDGACMTSTGTQNPSLTYMALTARAVDYACKQRQKGEL